MSQTSNASYFVLWVCRHFTKSQIKQFIKELEHILANRNPEVKPKDDFKERHPHRRQYHPDSIPPLTKPQTTSPHPNWKQLLTDIKKTEEELKPVQIRKGQKQVPKHLYCQHCTPPCPISITIMVQHHSQVRYKICNNFTPVSQRYRKKAKYLYPTLWTSLLSVERTKSNLCL
jgi:hypothetical protein